MEPENKFGFFRLNLTPLLQTLKLYLHEVWIRSQQEKVKKKKNVCNYHCDSSPFFPQGPVQKKKKMDDNLLIVLKCRRPV